jgi:hypothetical protein
MRDDRDYKVDLSAAAQQNVSSPQQSPAAATSRPFISVHFACCNIYMRIYRDADGKAYQGRCPRCAVPVNFPVGAGGTNARFFRVE